MARLTKPLTTTEINNAKAKPKDYRLSDGKGLFLLVKSNNSKLWRFNYYKPLSVPPKRTEMSLGKFPDVSLQQVRAIRGEYLALLAENIDPQYHKEQTERQEQQRIINTFKGVAESWKASKQGNIKPLTLLKYWGIVESYLMPRLANYPISEITPALAKSALDVPYKQGRAEMYRKSIKLLNAIMNHAVYSLFLIPTNPCQKISTAFEPLKRGKNPSIKPDELPDFFDRLENSDTDLLTKYLIQWQLLTMVRPNEAVTAEWADIDLDKALWTIPAEKMKQTKANEGIPHLVPLSKQAMRLLAKIQRLDKPSPYVFPSVRAVSRHINSQTANKAIRDNLGYRHQQTAHGLRKVASTYLHELGVMPDVIEMCLAHTIKGIRGVYNEADYFPHRKKALQQWGDFVAKCQVQATSKHLRIVV
ncbi:tyrosine-type recombinase/integrase [Testudinibacter sp. P27/CKL/0425]